MRSFNKIIFKKLRKLQQKPRLIQVFLFSIRYTDQRYDKVLNRVKFYFQGMKYFYMKGKQFVLH